MAYPRSVGKKKLENEGRIRLNASAPKPVAIHEVAAARVPTPVRIPGAQGAKAPQKVPKTVAVHEVAAARVPTPVHIHAAEQGAKAPQKVPKTVAVRGGNAPKLPMPHMPQQQRPNGVGLWQILPAFLATVNETVATYNSGAKGKKNLSGAAIGGVGQIIDTAKNAMAQKHPEYIPYLAAIRVNPDYDSAKKQLKDLKFDFDIRKRFDDYLKKNKNNIFEAIAVPPNRRESMSPVGIERVTEYLVNLGRSKGTFRTEEAARAYINGERDNIRKANDKVRQQYNGERDKILTLNAATMLAPEADQRSRGDLQSWLLYQQKNNVNLRNWLNLQPNATNQNNQPTQANIEDWKSKMIRSGDLWAKGLQKYIRDLPQRPLPKGEGQEGTEMQNLNEHMLGSNPMQVDVNSLVGIPSEEVPEERLQAEPEEMPAVGWQHIKDPKYGQKAVERVVTAGALRNAIDEVISDLPKVLGPVSIDTELLRRSAPDIARSLSSKMGITGEDWQRYDEMTRYARNPNLVDAPVIAPQIPRLGAIAPIPISGGNPHAASAWDEGMYVEPPDAKDPYSIGDQNQYQIRIQLGKFAAPTAAKRSANDVLTYIDQLPYLYAPMVYAPIPISIDELKPRANVLIRNIPSEMLKSQTSQIKRYVEDLRAINAKLVDTENKLVNAKKEKGELASKQTLIEMAAKLAEIYADEPKVVEGYYKMPEGVTPKNANDYIKNHFGKKLEKIDEEIASLENQRQEQRNAALEAQRILYKAQIAQRTMQTGDAANDGADQLIIQLLNAQHQLQEAIDKANDANDIVESAKYRYNDAQHILHNVSYSLNNKIESMKKDIEPREQFAYDYNAIKKNIDIIARTATYTPKNKLDTSIKSACKALTGISELNEKTMTILPEIPDYVIDYSNYHTMYRDAGALKMLNSKKYPPESKTSAALEKYLNHLKLDGENIYNLPDDVQRALLVRYYDSNINTLVERVRNVYVGEYKHIADDIEEGYKLLVEGAKNTINDYKDEKKNENLKDIYELKLKLNQVNAMYNDLKTQSSNIKNAAGKTIAEQIDIITQLQRHRDSSDGNIVKAQSAYLDAEAGLGSPQQPQIVQSGQSAPAPQLRLLAPQEQQLFAPQPQSQEQQLFAPQPQSQELQALTNVNPSMAAALEVANQPMMPPWIKTGLLSIAGLGVMVSTTLAVYKNYTEILKFKERIDNWFANEGKERLGEKYNQIKEKTDNILEKAEKNILEKAEKKGQYVILKEGNLQKMVPGKIESLIENAKSGVNIKDFKKNFDENAKKFGIPSLSMPNSDSLNISSLLGQQSQPPQQSQTGGLNNLISSIRSSIGSRLDGLFGQPPQQLQEQLLQNSNYHQIGQPPQATGGLSNWLDGLFGQQSQPPQPPQATGGLSNWLGGLFGQSTGGLSNWLGGLFGQPPQPMFAPDGGGKKFDEDDEDKKNKRK